jgi:hypothetical protein
MSRPFTLCYCLLLFIPNHAHSQQATTVPASRPYAAGPLTAADFAADPPADRGSILATTHSGIEHTLQYQGLPVAKGVRLLVTRLDAVATMSPAQSWNTAPGDMRLMDHEQGHFDISELHARKWQQQAAFLIKRRALGGQGPNQAQAFKAMQARVDAELTPINKAWREQQVLYDKETDHGRNREAQARWRERLDRELAEK